MTSISDIYLMLKIFDEFNILEEIEDKEIATFVNGNATRVHTIYYIGHFSIKHIFNVIASNKAKDDNLIMNNIYRYIRDVKRFSELTDKLKEVILQ